VPASREPQQPSLAGDLSCTRALSAQEDLRLARLRSNDFVV